ncbi:MAG: MopE-related protein [Sandaracinus sp.]
MQYRVWVGALAFWTVAGCGGGDTPAADAGGNEASVSETGACGACDDGQFCNGVETCNGGRCTPGTSPCMASQSCDEAMDRCVTACAALPDADRDGVDAIPCGGTDCNDADPNIHPGAMEMCDAFGVDEDCDPTTFGVRDADGDGHVAATCCNGASCGDDCDDARADVFTGSTETCNERDDDCDTAIDEGLATTTYAPDCDRDGYGNEAVASVTACGTPTTLLGCANGVWTATLGDCDDAMASVHPGASETCNGLDDDCNGTNDDSAVVDPICAAANTSVVHTQAICTGGACGLAPCDTGYGDCDGLVGTGCEIDLMSDAAHCGNCMTSCGPASVCQAGVCAPLVEIDAGATHTCARYATGRVVCWGFNGDGQLGDGTRTTRRHAVPVVGELTVSSISAGGTRARSGEHLTTDTGQSCGADARGVYCWGNGVLGQLGNGQSMSSSTPVTVSLLPIRTSTWVMPPSFPAIAVGGEMSSVIEMERPTGRPRTTPYFWGRIDMIPSSAQPTAIGGLMNVYEIGAGPTHVCVTSDNDGGVYCAGANGFGQLGVTSVTSSTTLVRATVLPTVSTWAVQVEAGGETESVVFGRPPRTGTTTCARIDSGVVYCWGAASFGQLGNGMAAAGTPVTGLSAADVTVGGLHACAVRGDGTIACWGDNAFGQLGDGTTTSSDVPVTVTGITTAVHVSAGADHTCAVLMDGSAWCWGNNELGQLGNDDALALQSSVPVRVHGT